MLDRVFTPGEQDVTHFFFPTRSIPFENACQLEDPNNNDYIEAHKQTDKDKKRFEKWLDYVNANNKGGNPVSPNKFEFSVMLERAKTSKSASTVVDGRG